MLAIAKMSSKSFTSTISNIISLLEKTFIGVKCNGLCYCEYRLSGAFLKDFIKCVLSVNWNKKKKPYEWIISAGLVEKKKCITEEKNKKKTQYVLKDHMFKFWYVLIPKAASVIEMGQGELY